MSRIITRSFYLLILSMLVTGCMNNRAGTGDMAMTTEKPSPETVKLAGGGPLGGYIEQFMDVNDKTKLSRALDGGIGKTTAWKNPGNGINYSVTPTRKVSLDQGGVCRAYIVKMTKSGITDSVDGTACVGSDGSWHVV